MNDRNGTATNRSRAALFLALSATAAVLPAFQLATPAGAASGVDEFAIPTSASDSESIVTGPDGNLWFVEFGGNKVGRITPAGVITEYEIPTTGSGPLVITAGPDGNLWFTEYFAGKIGKVDPADGTITEFALDNSGARPYAITTGPGDGNLWFTETAANAIGKITPAGVVTEYDVSGAQCASPYGIAAGPDGKLWYTGIGCGSSGGVVNSITTAGAYDTPTYPGVSSDPYGITAGPDGNMWFTENSRGMIGRITPSRVLTEFTIPTPNSQPQYIAVGSDGNLWFPEYGPSQLGRVTPAGGIVEYSIPTTGSKPVGITGGPASDGRVWFTEATGNNIGAIATSATPMAAVLGLSPASGPSAGGTQVVITGVTLSGATSVKFGSTEASAFTVDSDTQITATAPALPGGYHDVTVTSPAGTTNAIPADRYVSLAPLAISSISPTEGDPDGGTSVTVFGSGFTTASAVSFGGVPATDFSVNSDTQITATSPQQPDHTVVHITVTNLAGVSPATTTDQFTYLNVPRLDSLAPQWGPGSGGTPVVLTGANFTGVTAVNFGDATVGCPDGCQVVSDSEIHVLAPPHAVGGVPVTVSTADDGSSLAGPMFAFTSDGAYFPTGVCAPQCASGGLAVLPNGKILGVTGSGPSFEHSIVRANIYDPRTGKWTVAAECDGCTNGPGSLVLLPAGPAAVCGSNCGKAMLFPSAKLYDPATDTWSSAAPPPVDISTSSATLLLNGEVLIEEGTSGAVYDPATDSWASTGPLNHFRCSHTSTLLQDGRVLVTGGGGSGCPPTPPRQDTAEIYDPATNAWADTEPLAQGRLAHNAVRLGDGRVLVTGGTVNFLTAIRTAELYNPATGHWQAAPNTVFGRNSHDGTLLPDGRVLLSGGDEPFVTIGPYAVGNNPSIGEVLDPVSNKWTPTGPSLMLQDRAQNNQQWAARSVLLPSGPLSSCGTHCGQVLMIRGADVGGLTITLTPSAVLYAPAPRATLSAPAAGPTDGGTAVTITGTGLASMSSVSFGGVPATSVTPDPTTPDTKVVAVSPLHAPGAVDIAVTTAGGATIAGRFTFQTPVVATPTTPTTTTNTTTTTPSPATVPTLTTPLANLGYALAAGDGGVFNFGTLPFLGSLGSMRLNQPIVAIEHTPSGRGYWLVGADGGVFAFGDARFQGSTGAIRLARPIVGIKATRTGNGYWLVASDGGVFAFGDARFLGSTGAIRLAGPVVGMERSASGNGYWLVGSDGGIFAFGDAAFRGSTGAIRLARPVVDMARSAGGNGYWLVASDGGVFAFGDATFHGSAGALRLNSPIVGAAPATSGSGYLLCARDGGVFAFGAASFAGSLGGVRLNQPVVACSSSRTLLTP